MRKSLFQNFCLLPLSMALSACASQPENIVEKRTKDESCFATGSNIPRRDCSDVLKVDPNTVERGVATPRGPGPGR
jgi:hypothetical protein